MANRVVRKLITFNAGINKDASPSLLNDGECYNIADVLLTGNGIKMIKGDLTRESLTVASAAKIRLWEHYETRQDYDITEKRLVLYTGTADLLMTNSNAHVFSNSLTATAGLSISKKVRCAQLNGGMYFVDGVNKVKKIFGVPGVNAMSAIIGDMAPGAKESPGHSDKEFAWDGNPKCIAFAADDSIFVGTKVTGTGTYHLYYSYSASGIFSSNFDASYGLDINDAIVDGTNIIMLQGTQIITETGSATYIDAFGAGLECMSIRKIGTYFYVLTRNYLTSATKLHKFQLDGAGQIINETSVTLAHNGGVAFDYSLFGSSFYCCGTNKIYEFDITTGETISDITIDDNNSTVNSICQSDSGELYFCDNFNNRIGWAQTPSTIYYYGSNGAAPGQFNNPMGIKFKSSSDQIAVVDSGNYRVQFVKFRTNAINSVYTIEDIASPRTKPTATLLLTSSNPIVHGMYYIRYSYVYEKEDGYAESRPTDEFSFLVSSDTDGFQVNVLPDTNAVFTNIYLATPINPDYLLAITIPANSSAVIFENTRGIVPDNALTLYPYASRPPEGCEIISEHHNRMWYTKSNRIYISSLNRAEYCPDIFFDDTAPDQGGWIDVGNGEPITGLGMYGGFVFVFKKRGAWRISGDPGQQNFGMSPVDDTIGCDSHESIQLCENNILCWIGNGSVYAFNGEQIIELKGLRSVISSFTAAQRENSYAVYYPDKHWYEITIPTGATTGESYRYQFDTGGKWVRNLYSVATGHTLVRIDGSAIGINYSTSAPATLTIKNKFAAGSSYLPLTFESKRWEEPIGLTKTVTKAKLILDIPNTSNIMYFHCFLGNTGSSIKVENIPVYAQVTANSYCVEIPFRFPVHKVNAIEFAITGGQQSGNNFSIIGVELEYAIGGAS